MKTLKASLVILCLSAIRLTGAPQFDGGTFFMRPSKHESRLTLIKRISDRYVDDRGTVINPKGLYQCLCGKQIITSINNAKTGAVKSCGCLTKEHPHHFTHGLHDHPLYHVWQNIKRRCYNKKDKYYPLYGGRGVTMCKEWLADPALFIIWAIANGWKDGLQIDKDIKGGMIYSPENCTLVTSKENNNNRSNNQVIEFRGQSKNLTEWAELTGLNVSTIHVRIFKYKWSVEKALTTPSRQHKYLDKFKLLS